MPELTQLRCLVVLDEHRHFGRAAEALGMSQPALTKQLQRLEKEMGVRLVDRARRQIHPTAAGKLVLTRAQECLRTLAELQREVDLLQGKEIGSLAIGVGPAMAESVVPGAIAQLAEQYPRARLNVRVDHWKQLDEWLIEGKLDLYVADVTKVKGDEQVQIIPMPSEPLVVFCRHDHPLTRADRLGPADLLRYPLAVPRMPEWGQRWFADALGANPRTMRQQEFATIECENYTMLKRMVLSSLCVSAALRSTIDPELRSGALAALPIQAPPLKTQAGVVHLRYRTLSPLAEAFIAATVAAAQRLAAELNGQDGSRESPG